MNSSVATLAQDTSRGTRCAKPVDGAAARDGHDPGDRAAPAVVELRRSAPELEEGLLHDVLRLLQAAQDLHRDRHRARRVLVIERPKRGDIAGRHAHEERAVARAVGSADRRRSRGGREGPGQEVPVISSLRTERRKHASRPSAADPGAGSTRRACSGRGLAGLLPRGRTSAASPTGSCARCPTSPLP